MGSTKVSQGDDEEAKELGHEKQRQALICVFRG